MTTPQSHTANIRQTLNIAFDDSELSAFCLDYFPKVYDRFSQGMRKDDKITLLLDHCRRRQTGFETLLEAVRQEYTSKATSGEMSNLKREELSPVIDALKAYTEPSLASKPILGVLPFSGWSRKSIISIAKEIEDEGFDNLEKKIIWREFTPLSADKRRRREIERLRQYLMEVNVIHFSGIMTPVFEQSFLLLDTCFWLSIDDFMKIMPDERDVYFENTPLVFFNIRDNYARNPLHILNYVKLFDHLKALGVITSTLPIPAYFAAKFSEVFYGYLLQEKQLIGQALAEARQHCLEKWNNPFALFYAPYLSPSIKMRDSLFYVQSSSQ